MPLRPLSLPRASPASVALLFRSLEGTHLSLDAKPTRRIQGGLTSRFSALSLCKDLFPQMRPCVKLRGLERPSWAPRVHRSNEGVDRPCSPRHRRPCGQGWPRPLLGRAAVREKSSSGGGVTVSRQGSDWGGADGSPPRPGPPRTPALPPAPTSVWHIPCEVAGGLRSLPEGSAAPSAAARTQHGRLIRVGDPRGRGCPAARGTFSRSCCGHTLGTGVKAATDKISSGPQLAPGAGVARLCAPLHLPPLPGPCGFP